MKLSIIIPVFNERKTIAAILEKINKLKIKGVEKEIVLIDDGSNDGTREILNKKKVGKLILHDKNQGKGAAIRTGLDNSSGEYIIIQDADLEYDPAQIPSLIEPILKKKAEVVYGTRLSRLPHIFKEERTFQFLMHYLGNRFLSLLTSLLYGQFLTDMETCYKLFPRKAVKGMTLNARGFEFEPEITAKLLKKGYKILEISITTVPRGYGEGKKLNTVRDGLKAFWTLVKYRFADQ